MARLDRAIQYPPEFEREPIRERTKAGMAAAKRRGVKVGRPLKLTPFQIEQAVEMIKAGKSRADVAALLSVNAATLRRALNGVCHGNRQRISRPS
jgi:DNA invertase Pin-like site-specific DNA recombinase